MRKMKAVVLEKSGSRYTVLGQDGTFRQVHRRLNAEVGEEVQIQSWIERFSGVRIWAGAVALFLLVLTTILGWSLYQAPTAVALLSVDINPSLQVELDKQGDFVRFVTQNEDAKRMLSQIDLKGKPIKEVLDEIITQAYDQKFLSAEQHWVVVGYSPMTNKTLEQMPKELNENQIITWVTEIGQKRGLTPKVAFFFLTSQDRGLAQKGDLTIGEYALWRTADKAGVVTQPEKLKDTSERVRLLENSQVQVEIKAQQKERQANSRSYDGDMYQKSDNVKESGDTKANANAKDVINVKASENIKANAKDIPKTKATTKANTNAQNMDKQKVKDQEQYQKKDLTKAKDSGDKETQRTRYDTIYVPTHDTSRTYKFPEYNRDKQQRH